MFDWKGGSTISSMAFVPDNFHEGSMQFLLQFAMQSVNGRKTVTQHSVSSKSLVQNELRVLLTVHGESQEK